MSTEVDPASLQAHPPHYHSKVMSYKSLQGFSMLIKQIHQYASMHDRHKHPKLSTNDLVSQRFAQLQAINAAVDSLSHSCSLAESEKLDCLEEALKAIKLMHGLCSRKPAKANLRERECTEITKVTMQKELNVIQKLTDFLLQSSIPNEVTPRSLQHLLSVLIEMFFAIRVESEEKVKDKGKKREVQAPITTIQYCLRSGQKINLPWLIIFRVLQKKHQQVEFTRESVGESIETKISKSIKAILDFIRSINDSHAVLRNLLTCLVDNVKQMELPMVPLFLNIFYQALQDQFRDTYSLHRCIPGQLLLGKALYSLQNLNILCNLIKNVHNSMTSFQMQKQTFHQGFCSYCGLERQDVQTKSSFQAIRVKLPHGDQLLIRICFTCCQILGLQPENRTEVLYFAPLIVSKFWDWSSNNNTKEIRTCLKQLLIYHGYSPSKKTSNKSRKNSSIQIAEHIAMNNVEERTSTHLIEGLYHAFLFNHNILSLKNVIYGTLNLLLVCINSLEEKIKEKTLKLYNQPHIIGFVFNEQQRIPVVYAQQVNAFRQKFLAVILIKLRDESLSTRTACLQLLSSIYTREDIECSLKFDFYQTIYREIAFSNNPEYIGKSINIIERSIFKLLRYNNHQELLSFVQIIVQTFDFSLTCLNQLKQSHQPLKLQICKLVNKTLQTIMELSERDYEDCGKTKEIAHAFSEALKVKSINQTSLSSVYDILMVQTFREGIIDKQLIKHIPKITPALIDTLITPQMPYQLKARQAVTMNLLQIISIAFADVIEARQTVFGQLQKQSSKARVVFSVKQLRKYFFSQAFFDRLLSHRQNSGKIRQAVLNQLLSISNFCRLLSESIQTTGSLKAFLKSRDKWRNCIQFRSGELCTRLQEVGNTLWQQLTKCNIEGIPSYSALFINIKYFTQQAHTLDEEIFKYETLASKNIANLIADVRSFGASTQKQELYASIVNKYSLITRTMAILTSMVFSYEKIVSFALFVKGSQLRESKSRRKSLKGSKDELDPQTNQAKPSMFFQNSYRLLTEVLQIQFMEAGSDPQFQGFFKYMLVLCNSYWQLYPDLILSSSHLLKQLISNIDERGPIKGLYRLFLSLLPCSDMRILSIINHNFNESFRAVFENQWLRQDEQMLEYCFRLLQYMLRSGMTGLCGMNRYIFCGLLNPQKEVSHIASEIIKEIYSNQASERMLFSNFKDSMDFVYEFYFQSRDKSKLELPELQPQQVIAVRMVGSINRPNTKCLLAREKRELRIKPSFTKKISEIMTQKKRIIHDDPLRLIFLLKLVKAQENFDFSELYEILFAVNSIYAENVSFMEHLMEELENHEEWPRENVLTSLRIYLAYRELLSCLAYLSAYQPPGRQLAAYDKLFEATALPFLALREEVPLTPLAPTHTHTHLLSAIADDVEVFLEIVAGSMECVQSRRPLGSREDEDWSNTNETKPKGKRSKGKQSVGRNRTKNGRKMCMSGQKRPKTRACVKQEQEESANSSSLGASSESIY